MDDSFKDEGIYFEKYNVGPTGPQVLESIGAYARAKSGCSQVSWPVILLGR
jgi:hypothetical protein